MRGVAIVLVAGCADEAPLPAPVVDRIEPSVVCDDHRSPTILHVSGRNFLVNDDHTVASKLELWWETGRDTHVFGMLEPDRDGTSLRLYLSLGVAGPMRTEPPRLLELRIVNPDGQFGRYEPGLRAYAQFDFNKVTPNVAHQGTVVTMNLEGSGFYDAMDVFLETQARRSADAVQVTSPTTATATFTLDASIPPGVYAVTMRNPGRCEETIVSAFTVAP